MAFQAFPNGALAILEYEDGAGSWTNTLWFEDLLGPPADFQALADFLLSWSGTNIMPYLSNRVTLTKVTVYDMSIQLGQIYVSAGAPVVGGIDDYEAPRSVALVMTFYSAVRGRSGRGRNYIAGFADTQVDEDAVTDATARAALELAYTDLIQDVQTGPGFTWVVASKVGAGVPRPEILGFDILTVNIRSALLGSQRRRIPRP
jgi:hypothetical protein